MGADRPRLLIHARGPLPAHLRRRRECANSVAGTDADSRSGAHSAIPSASPVHGRRLAERPRPAEFGLLQRERHGLRHRRHHVSALGAAGQSRVSQRGLRCGAIRQRQRIVCDDVRGTAVRFASFGGGCASDVGAEHGCGGAARRVAGAVSGRLDGACSDRGKPEAAGGGGYVVGRF